ncbi:molybdopterin synthase catalytic subunit [Drosophila pseudoobscura]|uniref:Molybdopterin synthase catalytic subunit n=2 Tax=Drosophila pseudoobscura pseudoobscura TaxID=46245 RepID=MOC2B_DROPS|nr:molybdopterin synthase catalytic subunit [Drosophila pseudoobscura]Q297G3.2 RecName: Full=Molybdopterin synthase catalytic subunit; AltName: Full=Molybdenum cofactor synthesis protein 2 large subunit; AltName: Full=Molybdenum cofactor synthesis protein 2B; Short=MOCS2B [Drosophila pseudoobscura pseudoobscura]
MNHIKLIDCPIDVTYAINLISDPSCGASSIFIGTTRDSFQGKKVVSLAYEAYENMALKEMDKICSDLRATWPDLKHILIYHRLGTVPENEASVVIAASAPHRSAALKAVTFAIDQLKSRVPIWKKEIYEGNHDAEWKENSESIRPKKSLSSFNYSVCKVDESRVVSRNLVQIRANDCELKNRVECFFKRKRAEINSCNVIDFKQSNLSSNINSDTEVDVSCARTQSTISKQEQSNCHLKVRRATNRCGPQQMQFRPEYKHELSRLTASRVSTNEVGESLQNSRLHSIETYMGLTSKNNENIINRIKNVENRILLLESTSPEYQHFFEQSCMDQPEKKIKTNKTYSAHELRVYIHRKNKECP